LLFGGHQDVSLSELICSLPSGSDVDAMVELLAKENSIPSLLTIIHFPTLKKECEAFWNDPGAASLPWLALLFTVIALALQSTSQMPEQFESLALPEAASHTYTLRAAQCLIKSDYTKATTYTVEAMAS